MNPKSEGSPPTTEPKSLISPPEERKVNSLYINASFQQKQNFMDRCQKKFKSSFLLEIVLKTLKKIAVPILEKLTPDYLNLKTKLKFGEISPQHDEYSQYQEKEIIGEGSQGLVKRVINKKSSEEFAAKIIRKSDIEGITYYRKEFELLKAMDHPNILKVYEFFVREFHQTIIMVMELLTSPTLKDLIRLEHTLKNETLSARIFKQAVEGLEYLHLKGVCHRDLKPENIFVDCEGANLKIIDFGTAQYYLKRENLQNSEKKELWSPSGTETYRSPEQICGKSNEKSDIYALGLILYEMVTKKKPFGKKKGEKLLSLMEREIYDTESEIWHKFHPSLTDLLKQLLCPIENDRVSAKEAKNCQWLKEVLG